jgi:hypothetical protein
MRKKETVYHAAVANDYGDYTDRLFLIPTQYTCSAEELIKDEMLEEFVTGDSYSCEEVGYAAAVRLAWGHSRRLGKLPSRELSNQLASRWGKPLKLKSLSIEPIDIEVQDKASTEVTAGQEIGG